MNLPQPSKPERDEAEASAMSPGKRVALLFERLEEVFHVAYPWEHGKIRIGAAQHDHPHIKCHKSKPTKALP